MKNISLEYVRKVIARWDNGEIHATTYYYRIAREALACFDGYLNSEERSSIIGIIEVYNMSK